MPQVFAKLEFGGGSWAVGEEGRSHRTNTDRRELIPSIDHRSADSRIQGIATVARVHALPAAGYVKVQDYVPFNLWVGNAHTDPMIRGHVKLKPRFGKILCYMAHNLSLPQILESSITEYNNDLHASNMTIGKLTRYSGYHQVGIPILARHGGDDDNVPPWHSRKYTRLINEHAHDTRAA
ncbi:hypothetical protein BC938DRAFT_482944, partial [Jimgerdemannia flammicorona]